LGSVDITGKIGLSTITIQTRSTSYGFYPPSPKEKRKPIIEGFLVKEGADGSLKILRGVSIMPSSGVMFGKSTNP
jgi:hypothetical protein